MRHAVLLIGQQQAVPVGGGGLPLEVVVNPDARPLALAEAQRGAGNAAIDGEAAHRLARRADGLLADVQIVFHHARTGGDA